MTVRSGIVRRWGLLVLAGGAIMGLSLGIRQSQGLFMLPIAMDMTWTIEELGFAFALQNLVWGLTQPFTGMLADRFGSAKVILFGVMIYAAGLLAMAYSPEIVLFSINAGALVGIGLAGTAFGVVYGAVSKIVPSEDRGWAIGMVGAIGGFVQFLVVPFIHTLLDRYAWDGTMIVICVLFAALGPLAWFLRTKTADSSAAQGDISMVMAISEAMRHRGFWLLNLGFMACGFQLAFLAGHIPAYLVDRGLPLGVGGAAIALISLTNVAGTFVFGYVGGSIFRRKYALSFIYFCRSVAMIIFIALPLTPISTYLFAAVIGFLWLGTVPLTSGLVSQIFGTRYVTTLFGFVFFGHQLGAFFGIWLAGYVFDTTGSYMYIWWFSIGLGVLAGLLHLPINDKELLRPGNIKAVPA